MGIIDRWKQWSNKGSTHLYTLPNARFHIRPDTYDRFMIDEVWNHDEYFLDSIPSLPPGHIIDIGGHIGGFATKANLLFPHHSILAFEPAPDNYRLLRRNLRLNHCDGVKPISKAISNHQGQSTLYFDPSHTGGHSLIPISGKPAIQVDCTTLDAVTANEKIDAISYLKLDCEGSEYRILESISEEAWLRIGFLGVEFHPMEGIDALEVCARIVARGFRQLHQKKGYLPGQFTAVFQRLQYGIQ